MIVESEVLVMVIALGSLFFIAVYFERVKMIPFYFQLLSAYFILVIAWICTILESFIFYDFFNLIEHLSYFLNTVLILVWLLLVLKEKRSDDKNGN